MLKQTVQTTYETNHHRIAKEPLKGNYQTTFYGCMWQRFLLTNGLM